MEDMNHEKWDEKRARAWHLFLPPARPSKAEVALYEDALRGKQIPNKSLKILLLGSTPELRSLAHKHDCALTCVDFNASVFRVLYEMVSPKAKEDFHCSGWTEMDLDNRFDLIFGDGSINMLSSAKHKLFLSKVAEHLEGDGLAVLRVHMTAKPDFADPAEVFRWYRYVGCKEPVFTATRNHLDMLWLNRGTRCIDFVDFHRRIRKLYSFGLITDEEFSAYDRLLEFNRITLYYCEKEAFEESASELFEIVQILYGKDYLGHPLHPIYFLRKRDVI